jgi:type IV secretory pathway VirB4 component
MAPLSKQELESLLTIKEELQTRRENIISLLKEREKENLENYHTGNKNRKSHSPQNQEYSQNGDYSELRFDQNVQNAQGRLPPLSNRSSTYSGRTNGTLTQSNYSATTATNKSYSNYRIGSLLLQNFQALKRSPKMQTFFI